MFHLLLFAPVKLCNEGDLKNPFSKPEGRQLIPVAGNLFSHPLSPVRDLCITKKNSSQTEEAAESRVAGRNQAFFQERRFV